VLSIKLATRVCSESSTQRQLAGDGALTIYKLAERF